MPKSQSPRRPFAGNKFLIQSREYQTVQRQLTDLLVQVQLLQRIVLEMLPKPEPSIGDDALRTSPDVSQEEWDQYEADQDALSTPAVIPAEVNEILAAANEDSFTPPAQEIA